MTVGSNIACDIDVILYVIKMKSDTMHEIKIKSNIAVKIVHDIEKSDTGHGIIARSSK